MYSFPTVLLRRGISPAFFAAYSSFFCTVEQNSKSYEFLSTHLFVSIIGEFPVFYKCFSVRITARILFFHTPCRQILPYPFTLSCNTIHPSPSPSLIFFHLPHRKNGAAPRLYPVAGGDSLDWKDYDADTIFKRVTEHLQPGSIVLFHNAALHTPEALPSILEYMHQNGYTVVPIGELIYTENYSIDHAGRQSPVQPQTQPDAAPEAKAAQ